MVVESNQNDIAAAAVDIPTTTKEAWHDKDVEEWTFCCEAINDWFGFSNEKFILRMKKRREIWEIFLVELK